MNKVPCLALSSKKHSARRCSNSYYLIDSLHIYILQMSFHHYGNNHLLTDLSYYTRNLQWLMKSPELTKL